MSQDASAPLAARGRGADQVFRDALQLIAEGVTETVGFQLATISVVRTAPDGTLELEVIADAGDEEGSEAIIGRRTPLASLLAEIEDAEVWGQFRFLPHDQLGSQDVEPRSGSAGCVGARFSFQKSTNAFSSSHAEGPRTRT